MRGWPALVPDNASAIVADADAVNPRFTAGRLDYTQHCGFVTDPARIRSPRDKPRVERVVRYVRGNFFAGERFGGLAAPRPFPHCKPGKRTLFTRD